METIKIALVALGGYGNFYLEHLFNNLSDADIKFVAGIDPDPAGCHYLEKFERNKIPIYPDLETFYRHAYADLVIIAAPIHLHKRFTLTALSHSSNVLCEKPVTARVQDADAMFKAEKDSPGFVAIGYQWSFSQAIQNLKNDILKGAFGKPLRFRTKILWPRTAHYYGRNNWAGRIKTAAGEWVLDSPVNNATAHYLHNCFYVLGKTRESSADLVDVQAELYRANPIENYDTAAIRCHTDDGVEILFYTAHPVPNNIGPILSYEFEQADVKFDPVESRLRAYFHNGQVTDYGNPSENDAVKLWQSVASVRSGKKLACGLKAARSHTLCVNGAQESAEEIKNFPDTLIQHTSSDDDDLIWVNGLQEIMETCYEKGTLPSENDNTAWAHKGKIINLRNYRAYPTEI